MAERLIGVDVGGTKVAVAVLEGSGLAEVGSWPTDCDNEEELLEQFVTAIRAAGAADAVGIAVPSAVDFATGTARFSVNIPLAGVPLRDLLRERLGIPVLRRQRRQLRGARRGLRGRPLARRPPSRDAHGRDRHRRRHRDRRPHLPRRVRRGRRARAPDRRRGPVGRRARRAAASAPARVPGGARRRPRRCTRSRRSAAWRTARRRSSSPTRATTARWSACASSASASASASPTPSTPSIPTWSCWAEGSPQPPAICCSSRRGAWPRPTSCPGSGRRRASRLARYANKAGMRGAALLAGHELALEQGEDARRHVAAG